MAMMCRCVPRFRSLRQRNSHGCQGPPMTILATENPKILGLRRMSSMIPRWYRYRLRSDSLSLPFVKDALFRRFRSSACRTERRNVRNARRFSRAMALALIALSSAACHHKPAPIASSPLSNNPALSTSATPLRGAETSMTAVRFLEDRVKDDPDDLVALNKLANYYLQLYRETYDVKYLSLALRSARSSLQVLGADQNLGGLDALAQSEYATHDFIAARDHA